MCLLVFRGSTYASIAQFEARTATSPSGIRRSDASSTKETWCTTIARRAWSKHVRCRYYSEVRPSPRIFLHVPHPARALHGVPNTSNARSTVQHEGLRLRHLTPKHHKLIGLDRHEQDAVACVRAAARGKHEAIASCLQLRSYAIS